jgi:hypothetical protein
MFSWLGGLLLEMGDLLVEGGCEGLQLGDLGGEGQGVLLLEVEALA